MKLKTLKFYNDEDEKMTTLFLLDDENREYKHISLYNKKEEIEAQKELEDSMKNITDFIKEIYEMGKNGVELEFSEKDIFVNG